MEGRSITDKTWDAATEIMATASKWSTKITLFRLMHGPLPRARRTKERRVYLCAECGDLTFRAGTRARYCETCSKEVEKARLREWRRSH